MKRTQIFLIAVMLLSLCSISFGQVSMEKNIFGNRSFYATFPNTLIDSTATVYSEVFTLNGWDQGISATVPVYWTRLLASAKGKPRILIVLQGTNDETNYLAVDTLSVNADSTETYGTGSMSLNSYRFAKYRFKITGTAGNRTDTYAKFEIYIPYRREN